MLMTAMMLAAAVKTGSPDAATLRKMAARFAPTEVTADLSRLPAREREALAKMVEAARLMDTIYLRQAWAGNEPLLLRLSQDASPLGRARLHLFVIDKGPWSNLDHDAPFIPGVPPRPDAANFYPPGASKEEVESWVKSLSPGEREQATGFYTTIRRAPDGRFGWVPYGIEYQDQLGRAAQLLREAAELTAQPTLKKFLSLRADAFFSNDYYASDVAWMELDASIEPTIGPYEVYTDNWFNQKAAFEAFIAVRDEKESAKLSSLSSELQGIEDALPIDPRLRNPKLGALSPIRVVNLILASGDGNHGVQTAAYNLPNDERISRERGTKRVMLKNVQQAKFDKTLLPISRAALAAADRRNVSFDAFFTHIVMHELMHGLGPHRTAQGTTVRMAMQEAGSALEEAKADISGLFALQRLVDKGALDKGLERTMYVTFLASAFRSIRFGTNEAHGRGVALQLNSLLDDGAVRVAADGTFAVVPEKIKQAVAKLAGEIMTLQASGDVARAREWLTKMGVVRPEVKRVLDKLTSVPVDIEPRFTAAEKLLGEAASTSDEAR
ncbi:MAG: dipeptidyl-peptidase 3 family protein [Deltaproteobacteria bacterium]